MGNGLYNKQQLPRSQLPTTNYQLPIPNYQLPITYYPFPIPLKIFFQDFDGSKSGFFPTELICPGDALGRKAIA